MRQIFDQAWDNTVESVARIAPNVLVALVILLVGLVVAQISRAAVRRVLKKPFCQRTLDRLGMSQLLQSIGASGSPEAVLGTVIYYAVLILFLRSVVETLGLTSLSDAAGDLLAFLPDLLAAVLIFGVGILLSRAASAFVGQAAKSAQMPFASMVSRVVALIVILVAGTMALSHLHIDTKLLDRAATGVVAGVALGTALTFGLGTRDVSRNLIAGFYARRSFPPGKEVQVGEVRGTVVEVTPLQTVIRCEDADVGLPNDRLLQDQVRARFKD